MSPARATRAAQKLFEAGLVTYIRTDSVALAPEALEEIRGFLKCHYPHLLPELPITHREAGDAQASHEAIRPTDIRLQRPGGLSGDEEALYQLIWSRTLASQAAPAQVATTLVVIASGDESERLLAKGSELLFAGWSKIAGFQPDDVILPALCEDQELCLEELEISAAKTKPPARFTIRSLIKYLERRGVGRPSTCNSQISTLFERKYASQRGSGLVVEPLGSVANALMQRGFERLTREGSIAILAGAKQSS